MSSFLYNFVAGQQGNEEILYEAIAREVVCSLSEVETAGVWIDGKVIYKRWVSFGALPNATTKTVAHSITTLASVVDYYVIADNGTDQIRFAYGGEPTAHIDQTNVEVVATGNFSAYTISYVMIEYTKT